MHVLTEEEAKKKICPILYANAKRSGLKPYCLAKDCMVFNSAGQDWIQISDGHSEMKDMFFCGLQG